VNKLVILLASSIGGGIGWWLGEFGGLFMAFVVSMIGTGVGMYAGARFVREYMP
jgi:hypothetical protein